MRPGVDLVGRGQDLRRRVALAQEDVGLHLAGVRGDRVLRDELAGLRMPDEDDRDRCLQRLGQLEPLPGGAIGGGRTVRGDQHAPVQRLDPLPSTTSRRPRGHRVAIGGPAGAPPVRARTSCLALRTPPPARRRARRRARSARRPAHPRGPRPRPCAPPPPPPAARPSPRSARRRWHARTRTPRSAAPSPPWRAPRQQLRPPERTPSHPCRTRSACMPSRASPPREGRHDTLGAR